MRTKKPLTPSLRVRFQEVIDSVDRECLRFFTPKWEDPYDPRVRESFVRRCRHRGLPGDEAKRFFDRNWPQHIRKAQEEKRRKQAFEAVLDDVRALARSGALPPDHRDPRVGDYAISRLVSQDVSPREALARWGDHLDDYVNYDVVHLVFSNGKAADILPEAIAEGVEDAVALLREAAGSREKPDEDEDEILPFRSRWIYDDPVDQEIYDAFRSGGQERQMLHFVMRYLLDRPALGV